MWIITPNHQLSRQPFLFFKEKNSPLTLNSTESDPDNQLEVLDEKPLYCSTCLTAITSEKEAIAVNDLHHHTFFNPAGVVYEIRCFKKAAGCIILGDPSTEFSWFKNYTWQYDLCGGCRNHLGWYFQGQYDFFHGLIAHLLTSAQ
ncbi:MAG: cereblon family protein [Desulfobulbaceae bacterium]|nr:cereblon family protein [Desulfobulbaceae bacterium]